MECKGVILAYLAGALDGDGSFSLIKGSSKTSISPLYYPMIQLANASKNIIDLLYFEFGGHIGLRKSYIGKDGSKRLPSHYWKLEKSIKCLPVLEDVIPYLVIKKERAELLRNYILDNPFIRGSNKIDNSTLFNREKCYLKMRSLNDNPSVSAELYTQAKRINNDSELFWSYIAGLMDTDGSFSLKKENRKSGGSINPVYTPTILLTMVDNRAIYYLMNNFVGGNLMLIKAKTTNNGFCYRFNITSRKVAVDFLKKCIPYLLIKKEIASKLLEFCEQVQIKSGSKITQEQNLFRENYYIAIKNLNNGVYKSPLMDLKPLPGNAEGNKAEG